MTFFKMINTDLILMLNTKSIIVKHGIEADHLKQKKIKQMKRTYLYNGLRLFILMCTALPLILSCNKELPDATSITTAPPTGISIGSMLNDASYSILKAAVTKAGLTSLFADSTAVLTFFAPDDAAFIASGIPSAAALAAFRAGQLDTILRYHMIGGQAFTTSVLSSTFPNNYLQSNFVLAPPSTTLPPGLRMPVFPGKGTPGWYLNNIPIKQGDVIASNGVIHKVAALVMPPSLPLWNAMSADTALTYFIAAINRADSGTAAPSRLQDAFANSAANITLLAPNNAALKNVLFGSIYSSLLASGMPQATAFSTATTLAASPANFSRLPVASVKGIVVYHMIATASGTTYLPNVRIFSPNFPSNSYLKTMVNSSLAVHPGIIVQSTFTGPFITSLKFTGYGTFPGGGTPFSDPPANTVAMDKHCINGIYHVIDRVLLPQ